LKQTSCFGIDVFETANLGPLTFPPRLQGLHGGSYAPAASVDTHVDTTAHSYLVVGQ